MIDLTDGSRIELVSGEIVQSILDEFDDFKLYHVCYEVPDILAALERHVKAGGIIISEPKPAILFKGKLVSFVQTPFGLIELLQT